MPSLSFDRIEALLTSIDARYDGSFATITIGNTTTLAAGAPATVVNTGDGRDMVLDFGIPQGLAATIGVGTVTTGAAGTDAEVTNSGTSGAAVFDFTIPRGAVPTVAVGTVTTLAPDTPATVTNVGTAEAAVFDFGLPLPNTSVIEALTLRAEAADTAAGLEADRATTEANRAATEAANAASNSSGQNMAALSDALGFDITAMDHWDINDDDSDWLSSVSYASWENEALGTWERGTMQKHPRRLGIYGTSDGRVLMHDETGTTSELFLRFSGSWSYASGTMLILGGNPAVITSVKYRNGFLYVGTTHVDGITSGLHVIDILERGKRPCRLIREAGGSRLTLHENIAQRNANLGQGNEQSGVPVIYDTQINSIDLILEDDAPYDRLGLRTPTIVLGHGTAGVGSGGTTWIRYNDEVFRALTQAGAGGYNVTQVEATKDGKTITSQDFNGQYPSLNIFDDVPTQNYTQSGTYAESRNYLSGETGLNIFGATDGQSLLRDIKPAGKDIAIGLSDKVSILRENELDQALGSTRQFSADYSTSSMNGSTKAMLLCGTAVGTLSGAELVTNGDFDGTFTGWVAYNGATIEVDGNRLKATKGSSYGGANQQLSGLTVGRRYRVKFTYEKGDFNAVFVWASTGNGGAALGSATESDATGSGEFTFIAETTNPYLNMRGEIYQSGNGDVWFDNILVYEDVDEDSYIVNGTLEGSGEGWGLTGWNSGTFSGGTWTWTNPGNYTGVGQNLTGLTIGAVYAVEVDVVSTTWPDGNVRLYVGPFNNPSAAPNLLNVSIQTGGVRYFIATAETHALGLSSIGASDTVEIGEVRVYRHDNLIENSNFNSTDISNIENRSGGSATIAHNPIGALDLNGQADGRAVATWVFPTVIGETYRFSVTDAGSNPYGVLVGTSSGGEQVYSGADATGDQTQEFVATWTTTYLTVRSRAVASETATVDNVEVRHVIDPDINNLVSNPRFEADATGWEVGAFSASTRMSVANNRLRVETISGGNARVYQGITTIPGRRYRYFIDAYETAGSGNFQFKIGNSPGLNNQVVYDAADGETITGTFIAEKTTTYVTIQNNIGSGYVEADNIRVYEDDANLVTNGGFDVDSDWIKGAGWTISGGTADSDGTIGAIYLPINVDADQYYECSVDITFNAAGVAYWRLGDTTNLGVMSTSGTIKQRIKANASGAYIGIFANTQVTIDNVSVTPISNLIENGDFGADVSGWSAGGTSTITWNASGAIDLDRNGETANGGRTTGRQVVNNLVVGETYRIDYEVTAVSNEASVDVYDSGFTTAITPDNSSSSATGSRHLYFTATATSHGIGLGVRVLTTGTATFDNISLRHVPNVFADTFDSDITGWATYGSTPAVLSHAGGQMTVTAASTNEVHGGYHTFSVEADKTYRITADLVDTNTTNRYMRIGRNPGWMELGSRNNADFVVGSNEIIFTSTANETVYATFAVWTGTNYVTIDNVIVQEIPNLITGAPTLDDPFTYSNGTLTADGSVGTGGDWSYWDITVTPNVPHRFRSTFVNNGSFFLVRLSNGQTFDGDLLNWTEFSGTTTDTTFVPTGSTVRIGFYAPNSDYDYEATDIILEEVDQLLINGDFEETADGATPDGWQTNDGNASLIKQADGTALFTSNSFAYAQLTSARQLPLSAGLYEVSFDISDWTGSLSNVHIGIGVGGNTVAADGSYKYIFEAETAGDYDFQIRPNGGGTGSFKVDNIRVEAISSLVVNGDFENGDRDWTPFRSATIEGDTGRLKMTGGAESYPFAYQDISANLTEGEFIKVTATVENTASIPARVFISTASGNVSAGSIWNVPAGQTQDVLLYVPVNASAASEGHISLSLDGTDNGGIVYIDDVVIEKIPNLITGSPTLLSERMSYANGTLTIDGSQATTNGDWTYWDITVTPGSLYYFEALVNQLSGGSAHIRLLDGASFDTTLWETNFVADGQFRTIVKPSTSTIRFGIFGNSANYDYTVSNIILRETENHIENGDFALGTDGWHENIFGNGSITVDNGRAVIVGIDGSNFGRLEQVSQGLTIGQLYELKFTIYGDGTYLTGPTNGNYYAGEHTLQFEAGATSQVVYFQPIGNSGTFEVDNVTITPVVDLVTNGSFDSTAAGWLSAGAQSASEVTWTVDEGELIITRGTGGTAGSPFQSINFETGEVYRLTVVTTNTATIAVGATSAGLGSQVLATDAGTHTIEWKATSNTGSLQLWTNPDETVHVDSVSLVRLLPDRSHNESHAVLDTRIVDTVVVEPVATGAELTCMYVAGAQAVPRIDYSPEFASMTSWTVQFWLKRQQAVTWDALLSINGPTAQHGAGINHRDVGFGLDVLGATTGFTRASSTGILLDTDSWHMHTITCDGTDLRFYQDGVLLDTMAGGAIDLSLPDADHFYSIGTQLTTSPVPNPTNARQKRMTLFKIESTVSSADQIAHDYEVTRHWFNEDSQNTIGGASSDVLKLAYNDIEKILYVLTSAGLTSMSTVTWTRLEFDATKAGQTTLNALDQFLAIGNGTDTNVSGPAYNLREVAQRSPRTPKVTELEFEFDGSTDKTELPKGVRVLRVWLDGGKERPGASNDYVMRYNGHRWVIDWTASPAASSYAEVEVEQIL